MNLLLKYRWYKHFYKVYVEQILIAGVINYCHDLVKLNIKKQTRNYKAIKIGFFTFLPINLSIVIRVVINILLPLHLLWSGDILARTPSPIENLNYSVLLTQ